MNAPQDPFDTERFAGAVNSLRDDGGRPLPMTAEMRLEDFRTAKRRRRTAQTLGAAVACLGLVFGGVAVADTIQGRTSVTAASPTADVVHDAVAATLKETVRVHPLEAERPLPHADIRVDLKTGEEEGSAFADGTGIRWRSVDGVTYLAAEELGIAAGKTWARMDSSKGDGLLLGGPVRAMLRLAAGSDAVRLAGQEERRGVEASRYEVTVDAASVRSAFGSPAQEFGAMGVRTTVEVWVSDGRVVSLRMPVYPNAWDAELSYLTAEQWQERLDSRADEFFAVDLTDHGVALDVVKPRDGEIDRDWSRRTMVDLNPIEGPVSTQADPDFPGAPPGPVPSPNSSLVRR